jgi:hypothetical protein
VRPPEDWYADVGLSRITARYLWWALSANTQRTEETARTSYRTFAAVCGHDSPFPVTIQSLCNWMAYFGNRELMKSSTMKSDLTGLRSYCIHMGMDKDDLDIFRHPRVQRVEMESCAWLVRACLFVCLSAPALALYLVSMGPYWLEVCRRHSF